MKENDIIDGRYRLLKYQGSDGERFGEIWLVQDTRKPNSEPEYMVVSDRIFDSEYLLIRQLGVGGFGEVWKAKEIDSGVNVALKIHKDGDSVQATNKIVKEYTRVKGIQHDNLVTPTHVKIVGGKTAYLKMELCRRDIVGIELNEEEIWRLIRDVSSGLKRLAENQRWSEHKQCLEEDPIIHQDIKPENILLRPNGKYAISDFGISKRRLSSLTTTEADNDENPESWMTVAYAAPERFPRGVGHSVLASDIWSLGAMLYEIVEGHLPFAECGGDCLNPKIGLKIPTITRDGYSNELKLLIYDCMAKEPDKRPTAAQLMEYSGKALKGEPRKVEWAGANKDIKFDKTKRARKFKGNPWKQKSFPPKKEEKKKTPKWEREKKENVFLKNAILWISLRKKALGYISLVCIFLGMGYFLIPKIWSVLDSPERKAWRAAQEENTFASYTAFVESNSHGKHVNDALLKLIHLNIADRNLSGLNYVWNYTDTSTIDRANIHEEARDSISCLIRKWSNSINDFKDRLSYYSFAEAAYSDSSQMNELKTIVKHAIKIDSISKLLIDNFTLSNFSDTIRGQYYTRIINAHFNQQDIDSFYNKTIIPCIQMTDSVMRGGQNIIWAGWDATTDEMKPYYDSALTVVNQYIIIRQNED